MKMVFVCTFNQCRSVVAAALYKKANPEDTVLSAGVWSERVGWKVPPAYQRLLLNEGIDVSAHRARFLTPEVVVGADLIVVFMPWQHDAVLAMYPEAPVVMIESPVRNLKNPVLKEGAEERLNRLRLEAAQKSPGASTRLLRNV